MITKKIIGFFGLIILSCLIFIAPTQAQSGKCTPTFNNEIIPENCSMSVSNLFYGEPTEYTLTFKLPSGTIIDRMNIGMTTGNQDLSQANLTITGLPSEGITTIERRKNLSSGSIIQYILSPAITLSEDTTVTIQLTNIINQPYVHSDPAVGPQTPQVIGFSSVDIQNNNNLIAVKTLLGANEFRLRKRPSSTTFNTNFKFETTNNYFGEVANHTLCFDLPADIYVGRLGFNYNRQDVDLTNSTLEVTGLPQGTNVINYGQKTFNSLNHNLTYILPVTTHLNENSRVCFIVHNVKNPTNPKNDFLYALGEKEFLGITDKMISENTDGTYGDTSLLIYNYNYATSISLSGENWKFELAKKPQPIIENSIEKTTPTYTLTPTMNINSNSVATLIINKSSTSSSTDYSTTKPNINIESSAEISTTLLLPKFTRNLWQGIKGEDVKNLQKFLNSQGFIINKIGAGSPGNEVVNFGKATKLALLKFQKAERIKPANGIFGISTRIVINKKLNLK